MSGSHKNEHNQIGRGELPALFLAIKSAALGVELDGEMVSFLDVLKIAVSHHFTLDDDCHPEARELDIDEGEINNMLSNMGGRNNPLTGVEDGEHDHLQEGAAFASPLFGQTDAMAFDIEGSSSHATSTAKPSDAIAFDVEESSSHEPRKSQSADQQADANMNDTFDMDCERGAHFVQKM